MTLHICFVLRKSGTFWALGRILLISSEEGLYSRQIWPVFPGKGLYLCVLRNGLVHLSWVLLHIIICPAEGLYLLVLVKDCTCLFWGSRSRRCRAARALYVEYRSFRSPMTGLSGARASQTDAGRCPSPAHLWRTTPGRWSEVCSTETTHARHNTVPPDGSTWYPYVCVLVCLRGWVHIYPEGSTYWYPYVDSLAITNYYWYPLAITIDIH